MAGKEAEEEDSTSVSEQRVEDDPARRSFLRCFLVVTVVKDESSVSTSEDSEVDEGEVETSKGRLAEVEVREGNGEDERDCDVAMAYSSGYRSRRISSSLALRPTMRANFPSSKIFSTRSVRSAGVRESMLEG